MPHTATEIFRRKKQAGGTGSGDTDLVVVETDEICHSQKVLIGAKVKNWTNAKIRLSGGGARAKEEVQAASTYY